MRNAKKVKCEGQESEVGGEREIKLREEKEKRRL